MCTICSGVNLLVRIAPSPSLVGNRIEALYASRRDSGKRGKTGTIVPLHFTQESYEGSNKTARCRSERHRVWAGRPSHSSKEENAYVSTSCPVDRSHGPRRGRDVGGGGERCAQDRQYAGHIAQQQHE